MGEVVTDEDLEIIGDRKRKRILDYHLRKKLLTPVQCDCQNKAIKKNVQIVNSKPKKIVQKADFEIPAGIERNGNWFTLKDGTKVMGLKKLKEVLGV